MAHFAKISEENVVIHVTPLEDSLCNNSESEGQAYLEKHNNWPAHLWIKASYNTRTNKYFNNATGLLDSDQSNFLASTTLSILDKKSFCCCVGFTPSYSNING